MSTLNTPDRVRLVLLRAAHREDQDHETDELRRLRDTLQACVRRAVPIRQESA